jgi:hypothetical protein
MDQQIKEIEQDLEHHDADIVLRVIIQTVKIMNETNKKQEQTIQFYAESNQQSKKTIDILMELLRIHKKENERLQGIIHKRNKRWFRRFW